MFLTFNSLVIIVITLMMTMSIGLNRTEAFSYDRSSFVAAPKPHKSSRILLNIRSKPYLINDFNQRNRIKCILNTRSCLINQPKRQGPWKIRPIPAVIITIDGLPSIKCIDFPANCSTIGGNSPVLISSASIKDDNSQPSSECCLTGLITICSTCNMNHENLNDDFIHGNDP